MTKRPYKRRKPLANRYSGLCACGDHAWAVLTSGFVTLVSPEDAGLLRNGNWFASKNSQSDRLFYAKQTIGAKRPLHRIILGSPSSDIDHINRNGLDNRRENLRLCTQSQNLGNGCFQLGQSGFRGVFFDKRWKRWRAAIAHRHLGDFATPEEAARAYDAAAIKHFGRAFATLNFLNTKPRQAR